MVHATQTASKDPRYLKALRDQRKADDAIDGAVKFLEASVPEDAPYAYERATMDALEVLYAASKRLTAAFRAVRKEVGVENYKPYGRDFARRW